MKTREDAELLARTMVGIGSGYGTPVTALLTDMSQPLGTAVGNANEIVESIEILKGVGPPDTTEMVFVFAAEMLMLAGRDDPASARAEVDRVVASGAAFETFLSLVRAQGGDPHTIEDPSLLPTAPHQVELTADRSGFVSRCDALEVGLAAVHLGAGRAVKEDDVDPGVGVTVHAKLGDEVQAGERLATVSYRDSSRLDNARPYLDRAWKVSNEPTTVPDLILGAIT